MTMMMMLVKKLCKQHSRTGPAALIMDSTLANTQSK